MAASLSRRQFLLGRRGSQRRVARVGDGCLETLGVVCQACRDACPVGAVRFAAQQGGCSRPVVDPERCTGCGECASACPASALAVAPAP